MITITASEHYQITFERFDPSPDHNDAAAGLRHAPLSIYRDRTTGRFRHTQKVSGKPSHIPNTAQYKISWRRMETGETFYMGLIRRRFRRDTGGSQPSRTYRRAPYMRESGYQVWEVLLTPDCCALYHAAHYTMGWRANGGTFATLALAKAFAGTLIKREGVTEDWTQSEWEDYRMARVLGSNHPNLYKVLSADDVQAAYEAI